MATPAKGTLFLIPTVLAEDTASAVICRQVAEVTANLNYFLVENARTARRYIKSIAPNQTIENLQITVIDKNSTDAELTADGELKAATAARSAAAAPRQPTVSTSFPRRPPARTRRWASAASVNGIVADSSPFDHGADREEVGTDLQALVAWFERER